MVDSDEIPEGTVTVLFTDLVDSTRLNQMLGDDAAREVGSRVEQMARRVVASQRGVLIKEMGDGLMAAFASARRAVAAAQEIQVEMVRLRRGGLHNDVQMRIGLHTGEVINDSGDIHGETVIIAKRIEGLAPPDAILASETVYGVLGTARADLVAFGAVELKGIDDEWRLHLVPVPGDQEDRVLPDGEPTPYVGRGSEREQLRTMLEAAVGGSGSMVLIGAPAGLGKTRLTREVAAIADRLGMIVLTGHCVDMESPPPYQPSVDQLEQASRTASHDGFRRALGVNAPEVAKLLPSLRQRYDDIPAPPELTPEQERRYMLHGVGEFLQRTADDQPLLLIFEDLHWADESTMLLLRHIGARLADMRLIVLGTYRDDELEGTRPLTKAIGPLARDSGAVELHLQLLNRAEVAALVTGRAGQEAPPDLVDLIFDETQGNPFFVEELFRHLRDDGRLFDDDGAWLTGFDVGETEVPQGVRLLITRRLEQLDQEHRKVLASAAMIGRAFAFADLAAVVDQSEDDLFDALEAAERAHLVEELTEGRDAGYLFVHEQIRQTLVGELSLARRQRLHLRIADAIEANGSATDLAHHLLSAGSFAPPERAVAAFVASARAGIESLAFEDALRPLDHAVELDDGTARSELCELRVRALRGAGRVDDALEVLDAELAVTEDRAAVNTLRLQRVRLLNEQYRAAEGLADIESLLEAAIEDDDGELELAVQLARGRAHYVLSLDRTAHAEESRDAYEAAYAIAKRRGDKASMARALLPTSWFVDYWANYRATADANVEEARRLAEEIGDEDLLLDARSAALQRGGSSAMSLDASEALLARLEERRDPVKLNAHCFWMMWQYQWSGHFEKSVAVCDRGIELAELIGSAPVQYGSIKAIALTEMGRFDEVAAAIEQEVTDDDHPFGQAIAELARSVYLVRVGAWEAAAAVLPDVLERARSVTRVWMERWALSMQAVVAAHLRALGGPVAPDAPGGDQAPPGGLTGAEIALMEQRFDDAADLAARSAADQDGFPTPNQARALDLTARAHLAKGDLVAAASAASRGLAIAESMDFGTLVWRLRMVDAVARGEPTDRAAAEFRILADRIPEHELRACFERLPLAPR